MNRIKELRVEKKITQSQLAKILGVNQTAVGKYERGDLEPNIQILNNLADFFGVSIDYILGREDDLGIKGYAPAKERISAAEPLSGEEEDLLKDFRKLGVFARSSILIQVRALAEKAEKEEQKQK